MKNYFLALLVVLLGGHAAFAQMGYGKPEDIAKVETRTLLVVLNDVDKSIYGKLKGDEKNAYEQSVAEYNEGVKKAFASTWTFSKNVEYVTTSAYEAIADDKAKASQYAYFKLKIHNKAYVSFAVPKTYTFDIGLAEDKKPVYTMMFYTPNPNEADVTFILQQFQSYFKARVDRKANGKSAREQLAEVMAKAPMLKEKTLLIDRETIDKGVEEKMASLYKYKFQFCSKEFIDKAIIAKDASYAYIKMVPASQDVDRDMTGGSGSAMVNTYFMQYVINAANGDNISLVQSYNTKGRTSASDIKEIAKSTGK